MKKILLSTLICVALFSQSFIAKASSTTASVNSTASLASTCTIGGGSISFGTISPSASQTTGIGTINVLCTSTTTYDLSFSAGNSGNQLQRTMKGASSTDSLQYNIYTDTSYATIIGDGSSGTSHPLNGIYSGRAFTGGLQGGRNIYGSVGRTVTFNIYGAVAGNQYITPDNYSDSLTITLTY